LLKEKEQPLPLVTNYRLATERNLFKFPNIFERKNLEFQVKSTLWLESIAI
jgi:hypothetical protein